MIILSQKETNNHMISLICGICNTTYKNLSVEQKETLRHGEQSGGCQWGGGWDGVEWKVEVRCKLLEIGWITNKILLHSTGNYIQYPMTKHNVKKNTKYNVYMCINESLFYTAKINTTLYISSTSIKKKKPRTL